MGSRIRLSSASLLLLPAFLLAGCGSDSGSDPTAPTLSSITATPATVVLAPTETAQLAVMGHYSDGSSAAITSGASFSSSAPSVATVSGTGLITAVAQGTATVTVSGSGKTAGAAVTVTAPPSVGLVFGDDFAPGVSFTAFGGSTGAPTVDTTEYQSGTAALRIAIPAAGWTGGALLHATPQNVASFNALTFWAKASRAATLNVTGIGNDASPGGNTLSVEAADLPLTTAWVKHVIPLPDPSKATALSGLFHFAEGSDQGAYTLWLDEVQFENLPGAALALPTAAAVTWPTVNGLAVSDTFQIPAPDLFNKVTYTLPALQLTKVSFRWFTLTSSAPAVATVDADGEVTGVSVGSASITARLGTLNVPGSATVSVVAGSPADIAAAPTAAPADVISLFSATYAGTVNDKSANVDTWFTPWSGDGGSLTDPFVIPGTSHEVKKYVLRNYIGIEFIGGNDLGSPPVGTREIDIATPGMTHLHMDVWSPDGSHLVIKLIDAGPDKVIKDGADDDSTKITMGGITLPGQSRWVPLDISIKSMAVQEAAWTGKNVGQIVIALDMPIPGGTLFVDNVYFYKSTGGGGGAGPPNVAVAPTVPAANVISLFSSAYTGGEAGGDYSGRVDSYHADCFTGPPGAVTLDDHTITGTSHVVKRYEMSASTFGIISTIGAAGGTATPPDACSDGMQTGAHLVDVSAMTTLHFDVWSPGGSNNFQVQLVNADAGTISGPGQGAGATPGTTASSSQRTVAAGGWVSFDIPIADLSPAVPAPRFQKLGLVKFFSEQAGTFFIDNVYFHN